MNRLDVKKFLNNCPDKDFINFLISHTNLSDLELKVIYFKTNKCFTDEKISEEFNKSIEYTRKLVRKTFDKIYDKWHILFEYIIKFK